MSRASIVPRLLAIAAKRSERACAFGVGGWLIEPDLSRMTSTDRQVSFEPKAMEVLLCLVRSDGEVLIRKDIIKTVWPEGRTRDG